MSAAVAAALLAVLAVLVVVTPSRGPRRAAALANRGRLAAAGSERSGRSKLSGPRQPGFRAARLRVGTVVAAAAAGCLAVGAAAGPPIAVAAAALCGLTVTLVRDVRTRRAADARRRAVVTAAGILGSELAAGARPDDALRAAAEAAGPLSGPFTDAADAAAAGSDAAAPLESSDEPGVRCVGLAWRLGSTTGAAQAAVLARVTADLAAEQEQRRAVAVALAGPRSSAAVLAGLPVLGIGLGVAMGAHPATFLLGAGAGRAVACVGVLLDVAGVLWMRRIVAGAERA